MKPKYQIFYTICFSEIFKFAEEHYGINWNPCNDVFFGTVLKYGSRDVININDLLGSIDPINEEAERMIKEYGYTCKPYQLVSKIQVADTFTKEQILAMDNNTKAHIIVLHFMQHNEVEHQMLVDNT